MRLFATRNVSLLAVVSLVAAACGSGTGSPAPGGSGPAGSGQLGGTVTVIGTWGAEEQEAFLAMVKPWEDRTGAKVQYTGTRDLNAVLTTGVASGILPDLAGLPGPGQMAEFARAGKLIDLSTVLDTAKYNEETAPAFVELGTVDGKLSGVFIKSAVKGLIWYNKANFEGDAPATWADLTGTDPAPAEALWCIAVESGAASGWPGTDWIEDIVLRQAGPEVYDAWVAGTQKWTSPEIKAAFETFGEAVANSYGGSDYIINTAFQQTGNELFTDPPGCKFVHQASFISSMFQDESGAGPDDFDFFVMPDINEEFTGSLTGAGDLFGMFHDTPQARSLMQWLVTPEAQQIWVDIGGAISGNTKVTTYPNAVDTRLAETLGAATTFRFDASDLMPEAMNNAFWSAILEYIQKPDGLDAILTGLDATQADAYGE